MKKIILLCLLSLNAFAGIEEILQYPEDRVYTSADRGMRPYLAQSLYKTGTFALTFDDGPNLVITPQILDVLKKHNKKAIFFVLTAHINAENKFLIKRMLDEGHLVGSHSPNHDRPAGLTKEQFKQQTKESFQVLSKLYKEAGHEFNKIYYRFPYGDYGTRKDYHHINVLKEVSQELTGGNCIQMVFWDVDTADWVPGMTSEEVTHNIIAHNEGGTIIDFKLVNGTYVKNPIPLNNPPGGGVILQHDVHAVNIKALDLYLDYAEAHGIHVPRIDDVEEFKVTKNCKL